MLWIGTDEAGYGPNLGPLVVAASVWKIPSTIKPIPGTLYDELSDVLSRAPGGRREALDRLPVADSKKLHSSAAGISLLECGVLAMGATLRRTPATWHELWRKFASTSRAPAEAGPWYENYEAATPLEVSSEEIVRWSTRLQQAFTRAGVQLIDLRAAVVFPDDFNQRVETEGGKGALLSNTTLALARDLLETHGGGPALISCDKHGGRNRYSELLYRHWPTDWIETREEGPTVSCYRWGAEANRIEIEFRVGGEDSLPCALASMLAKYLRERAMEAFNAYWMARVPGLKPTAGYPVDAQRFHQSIAAVQRNLAIPDALLWRCR